MKIGIIVAMDKEFVQLKSLLSDATVERYHHKDFVTGNIGEKEIVIQKCGMGKVNSRPLLPGPYYIYWRCRRCRHGDECNGRCGRHRIPLP